MLLSETFCELFNDPGMSFIEVNIKMTTTVGFFSSHGFLACTCHGFFLMSLLELVYYKDIRNSDILH